MAQLDWEAKLARFNGFFISPTTSPHNIKPKSFSMKTRESSVQVYIATLCK